MEFGNIVSLVGGIALFLFGMSVMGDSLKKLAGNKLELILYKLSGSPLKGILLGTGVTAVIQSSSATSVMVVGFVNSGMMKVRQAIGIIMGAILGTSVTGWILCLNSLGGSGAGIASIFSTEILTGIAALAGIILWMFSKKTVSKNIGGITLGFAVLMYGMSMMSGALSPLRENEAFLKLLTGFSHPVIGILVGLAVTAALQSASAAVGILQALSISGAITFEIAFPIIMGIGIGAAVPVMLSAFGANVAGKRTAFVYLIVNILGALICGTILYSLNAILRFGFMGRQMNMVSIALVNSLFRLASVIVLSPFIGLLEKIVSRMFPSTPEAIAEQENMEKLEERFVMHPALALEQSRSVIETMAAKANESVGCAVEARRSMGKSGTKMIFELESQIDKYEDKIGAYLAKITLGDLNAEQTKEINMYLRVLSDFERISDHAKNIGEAAEEIKEKKISFSEQGQTELTVLENAVMEIIGTAINAFLEKDREKALDVDALEEVVDRLCDEIKSRHISRISRRECTIEHGFVFNDLLTDYERIADHCSNIALAANETNEGVTAHEYHLLTQVIRSEDFIRKTKTYTERFAI